MKPYIKICIPHLNAWEYDKNKRAIPNVLPLPIERALNDLVGKRAVFGVNYDTPKFSFYIATCCSTWVDYGRNTLIKGNISDRLSDCKPHKEFTHFLHTDPDMYWTYADIITLLRHDKDIVSAAYLDRLAYTEGRKEFCAGTLKNEFQIDKLLPVNSKGLKSVDWHGMGGCLVKSKMYDKIPYPWYNPHYREWSPNGKDKYSLPIKDDIAFCILAREHGFELYCDCDTVIYHDLEGDKMDKDALLKKLGEISLSWKAAQRQVDRWSNAVSKNNSEHNEIEAQLLELTKKEADNLAAEKKN